MIEGGSAYLRHMAATDATCDQSYVRKTSTVLWCVPQRSLPGNDADVEKGDVPEVRQFI
jgi:hypothetical protein